MQKLNVKLQNDIYLTDAYHIETEKVNIDEREWERFCKLFDK